MTVKKEYDFSRFEPWSGAKDTWNRLEESGMLDAFENMLEELYPEGIEETQLNDLLWFDDDWIYETLGMETESSLREKIDEKEEELDNLLSEWAEVVQDNDYSEEEKAKIWETDYKDDVEDLKDEIRELNEQLAEL